MKIYYSHLKELLRNHLEKTRESMLEDFHVCHILVVGTAFTHTLRQSNVSKWKWKNWAKHHLNGFGNLGQWLLSKRSVSPGRIWNSVGIFVVVIWHLVPTFRNFKSLVLHETFTHTEEWPSPKYQKCIPVEYNIMMVNGRGMKKWVWSGN